MEYEERLWQAWNRGVEAIAAYIREHGSAYPPPDVRMPDGRILIRWADNARLAYSKGAMPPARVKSLEDIDGWEWRQQRQRAAFVGSGKTGLINRARSLAAWVERTGGLPRQRLDEIEGVDRLAVSPEQAEEDSLAFFATRCRQLELDGELPDEVRDVLEAVPGWEWHLVRRWQARLEQVRKFVAENGCLPQHREDAEDEERRLNEWLRHNTGRNWDQLDSERREALSALLDGSLRRTWATSFEEAMLAYGTSMACYHHRWVKREREAAAAGSRSREQVRLIKTLPDPYLTGLAPGTPHETSVPEKPSSPTAHATCTCGWSGGPARRGPDRRWQAMADADEHYNSQ